MARELEALDNWWPFKNSSSKTDYCKWNGITCNDAGRVAEISVQECDYNFWNLLLDELDVLAFLYITRIRLSSTCWLYGKIPTQIGNLSILTCLNLTRNYLSAELPLSLANLTKLEVVDISYNNYIYGTIPPEIGNVKNLVVLDLSNNNIDGSLPASLGQLTSLKYLNLSFNGITGLLPPTLGKLTSLESFRN